MRLFIVYERWAAWRTFVGAYWRVVQASPN